MEFDEMINLAKKADGIKTENQNTPLVQNADGGVKKQEGDGTEIKTDVATDKGTEQKFELTEDLAFQFLDKDNTYLKYLSKKLEKDVNSLDDLYVEKVVEKEIVKEPELPEVVQKFRDYVINTGRDSVEDFINANKDWNSESKEAVVMEYIRQTKGYDKDELNEYFNFLYKPNPDEVSERDLKKAQFEFNADYKAALTYMNEQKSKFSLPSETLNTQRQAQDLEMEQKRKFSEGMLKAMKEVSEIAIDDVKLVLDKSGDSEVGFSSLDGIVKQYQTKDGFDYASLYKDLHIGRNFKKMASAYSDQKMNSYIESERAKLENRDGKGTPRQDNISETQGLENARKVIFGL